MSLDKKPSRRLFLKGAVATASLGVVGALKLHDMAKEPHQEREPAEDVTAPEASFERELPEFVKLERHPRSYDTSELAGYKLGYPFTTYFDHTGEFQPKTNIDFKFQLGRMWIDKAKRMGMLHTPETHRTVTQLEDVIRHSKDPRWDEIDHIVMSYDPDHCNKMPMAYYYHELGSAIKEAHAAIHWDKIKQQYRMTPEQAAFLERAAQVVDAQTLFAFNISEIMPAVNELAFKGFATLLETAGADFFYRIPSDDNKYSYGPGQVIEELFENKRDSKGSLTIMRQYLTKELLPKKFSQLNGREHHIASYLDGVFNLIALTKRLSAEQAAVLQRMPIEDDIRLFVSGAHNSPRTARDSFQRFAGACLVDAKHHGNVQPRFATFTQQTKIAAYVERSYTNLLHIRQKGGLG